MNAEFLKLLLAFINALVEQKVAKKTNEALKQGFVDLDGDGKPDEKVEETKVALADAIGIDPKEIDVHLV